MLGALWNSPVLCSIPQSPMLQDFLLSPDQLEDLDRYVLPVICDRICEKSLIHASDFVSITSCISELLGQNFQSYKCNDRIVLLLNFKAVGQTQAELHSLKCEKLDACISPLFAYLVTIYISS